MESWLSTEGKYLEEKYFAPLCAYFASPSTWTMSSTEQYQRRSKPTKNFWLGLHWANIFFKNRRFLNYLITYHCHVRSNSVSFKHHTWQTLDLAVKDFMGAFLDTSLSLMLTRLLQHVKFKSMRNHCQGIEFETDECKVQGWSEDHLLPAAPECSTRARYSSCSCAWDQLRSEKKAIGNVVRKDKEECFAFIFL